MAASSAQRSGKRTKTKYVGVFYYYVNPIGGRVAIPAPDEDNGGKQATAPKQDKMFVVTFKRPGSRKQHESTIGRESKFITASYASRKRAAFIDGEKTPEELRSEAKQATTLTQQELEQKAREDFTVNDAFLEYSKRKYSSKAQDKSRYTLHIKPICGDTPVSKLSVRILENIKTTATENACMPQTVKHILALLRRMINWSKKLKLCIIPDDLEFEMPSFDNQVSHEHYNEEELAVLIAKLEDAEQTYPVGSGFLQCVIYTGLRPIQIRHLKWRDVDFKRNIITVRVKGTTENKKATIPLNELAKNLFERMSKHDVYVFPSSRGGILGDYRHQIFKALDGLELPEDFRPVYALRHNFASWFASLEGTDIYMLRDLLTHTDIRTTQRYAHLFNKDKKEQSDRVASKLKSFQTAREKPEEEGMAGRILIKPKTGAQNEGDKGRRDHKRKAKARTKRKATKAAQPSQ